ncbi:hypothetical protein Q9299_19770 [Gemmobacter fulvus]|uniref:hypothetical protein n=1 Tax=Gemmobacter fulvus TaxID=2840474 RepID=UPI002796D29E|nr:hypothetical protein [Gemmobacter fulvus]MDQ1850548.1 hypothetical protein [Gemmobacter fulvus]
MSKTKRKSKDAASKSRAAQNPILPDLPQTYAQTAPQTAAALAQSIEEALTLLSGRTRHMELQADMLAAHQAAPLPSLLARCESLLEAQNSAPAAPLRLVHGFACTGEAEFAALLGLVPNLRLLPGLDPFHTFAGAGMAPQPSDIFGQVLAQPAASQMQTDSRAMQEDAVSAALHALHAGHERQGLHLIMRCYSQSRYDAAPAGPGLHRLLESSLAGAEAPPVCGLVMVCHPLLSYLRAQARGQLHFQPASLENYAMRYLAFLADHAALPIITAEDIADAPERSLHRIAQHLHLTLPDDLAARIELATALAPQRPPEAAPGLLLVYGDGTPATEEPLDSPAYLTLCDRLGYAPDRLPAMAHPSAQTDAMPPAAPRRALPSHASGSSRARLSSFLPLLARVTRDTAQPSPLLIPAAQLLDVSDLVRLVETCLDSPEGFYEALDQTSRQLPPQDSALLFLSCAAHFAAKGENIHALGLLAEATDAIPADARPLRLLAADLYLRLRKPDMALTLLSGDALSGPLQMSAPQRQALQAAIGNHAPAAVSEHGHALLLSHLAAHPPVPAADRPRVMIEIGTTRERVPGQGSTEKLARYCAEHGMEFITVDMDPRNSAVARRMFRRLGLPFRAATAKGEDFLAAWQGQIDYVFLDAYDFDHGKHSELRQSRYESFLGSRIEDAQCHQMHLDCAVSLVEKLAPDGVICFDDTWLDADKAWTAKGKTAMPYLLAHGFRVLEAHNNAALLLRG